MVVKDVNECDFVNYKLPSMFIAFPKCTFKCDKLNKCDCCQNSQLVHEPDIEISKEELCERYLANPITKAVVLGGLEPFDSEMDTLGFIHTLRIKYECNDDIVIYTGYTREELEDGWRDDGLEGAREIHKNFWETIKSYTNIIVKYGRFLINSDSHFDETLGVTLASKNQYAEAINNVYSTQEKPKN